MIGIQPRLGVNILERVSRHALLGSASFWKIVFILWLTIFLRQQYKERMHQSTLQSLKIKPHFNASERKSKMYRSGSARGVQKWVGVLRGRR